MKQNKNVGIIILLILSIYMLASCSKSFLEAKPDSDIVIPSTLAECRKLLDNDGWLQLGLNLSFPALGQLASDEYYYSEQTWKSTVFVQERNAYVWADDIYEGSTQVNEWGNSYNAIYICNVVLSVLETIEINDNNRKEYEDLKGTALFFRAIWNFALAEIFCMPYDKNTSAGKLGIPLRFTPNIDLIEQRASLELTYQTILKDLNDALKLLQLQAPSNLKNRPSKSAAHALLARVLLVMGEYKQAYNHADSSLQLHKYLLDYNNLSLGADAVFDRNNPELLLMANIKGYVAIAAGSIAPNSFIDSTLIDLYDINDLRLKAFFTFNNEGKALRKSLYNSGMSVSNCFNGLATDEVFLIKAECLARDNELTQAAKIIEHLHKHRYLKDTWLPVTFNNKQEALKIILAERRKELLFRGLRWSDVRRLNVEGYGIEMKRILGDKEFILAPNSLKYAFQIPYYEVGLSQIEQNPR